MKIETTTKVLQQVVRSVARATQKNPQLPVLGCIVFVVSKNKTTLQATNLDIGVEYTLPTKTSSDGTVAVPATVLHSFISTFSGDEPVTLEARNDTLHVTTSKGTTTIKTIEHTDFPTLPKVRGGTTFTLSAKKLYESFSSVAFCASVSMIRPELASVYLKGDTEGLTSVATDSFRLAEKKISIDKNTEFDPILIPAKNISDINLLLEDSDTISVSLNEHHITFDTGKAFLTSRLTTGNFPDYTQIIPREFVAHATVLSQDIIDTLKKIAIFSDSFHKVTITADATKKEFLFQAKNTDIGETYESLPAALEGDIITQSFNYRYISEVYQVLKSDSTIFSFSGIGKPLLIEGVGDTSFLYLVMPMNQ